MGLEETKEHSVMNYVLLTGAGFSRNWGGWLADECFEYLLSCAEITPVIRRELWKSKVRKLGFENTLQELRSLSAKHGDDRHRSELSAFETMLEGMFHTMRIGFERVQFEPAHDIPRVGSTPYFVRDFLAKFDAIFTLNQDTLLEQQYRIGNLLKASEGKWFGLGCMVQPIGTEAEPIRPCWNKSSDIDAVLLLTWYRDKFRRSTRQPDTRLMVIGYEFQDAHINAMIHAAAPSGVAIFIIDPKGVDILDNAPSPDGLKEGMKLALQENIVGASRRSLADTLSGDTVERTKLTKFFTHL